MIARVTIFVVLVIFLNVSPCCAQRYTRQGAVVGGATGAVIGGLIGKQTDKTTGGALIGGAVGALAGGVMGNKYDTDLARQRYAHQQSLYAQQQYYTQHYSQPQQVAQSGVSIADVISLSRSGVSDAVIISQVQSRGVQRRLEVSDIISLHQQGVSDSVISAMQNAPLVNQVSTIRAGQPIVVPQPPVIIHEQPVIYSNPPVIYEQYRAYPVYRQGTTRGF